MNTSPTFNSDIGIQPRHVEGAVEGYQLDSGSTITLSHETDDDHHVTLRSQSVMKLRMMMMMMKSKNC